MSRGYPEHLQMLVCLLVVLEEIPIRPARKQEVLEYIQDCRYLDIRPKDIESYITQTEPRWNTDIAFRRKDGVERGLLFNNQRDAWELTRDGIEKLGKIKKAFASNKYDVRECYLWTGRLKKILNPSYLPSSADKLRPCDAIQHAIRDLL